MSKHWKEQKEKGNNFFLNLTALLVKFCPKIILNFIIKIVSFFYYIFSPQEKRNIKAYRKHLKNYFKNKICLKHGVFYHFNSFADSICDKFAVYQGKILKKNIIIKNKTVFKEELIDAKKGQIILVSHLGNVEISSAISAYAENFKLNILVYHNHAKKFNDALNKFKNNKIHMIYIENLDINAMISLKKLIDNGEHLGIMADRIPIKGSKLLSLDFLGKKAKFPMGGFLLAMLLKTKISTIWCQKIKNNYEISLEPLAAKIPIGQNKEKIILPFMQNYVNILEKKCLKTPYQWYNFYDFWSELD